MPDWRGWDKMRKPILIVAAIPAALFMLLALPAMAKDAPADGSPGGDFRDVCDPGQFMVGIQARTGSWIDQVRIVCAPFNPGGSFGLLSPHANRRGGEGGEGTEKICPAKTAIVGAIAVFTRTGDVELVKSLEFTCSSPTIHSTELETIAVGNFKEPSGGLFSELPFSTTPFLNAPRKSDCGHGQAAIGLAGGYGRYVNDAWLICGAFSITELPAPVTGGGQPDPLVASDLEITGKAAQDCEAARQRNLARCVTRFGANLVPRNICDAEAQQRAASCQGLAAAAAAAAASDLEVAGKSPQECEDTRQRNLARCVTRFGTNLVPRNICDAEAQQRAASCQGLAAASAASGGGGGGGGGGQLARVILPTNTYDAPNGNGTETGALAFGAVVTIRDVGEDWYEVFGDVVPGGRGYVYSGAGHRSLREE